MIRHAEVPSTIPLQNGKQALLLGNVSRTIGHYVTITHPKFSQIFPNFVHIVFLGTIKSERFYDKSLLLSQDPL